MRLIPGKIKVKIELFKGISLTDIAIGMATFGLLALVMTSSLPGKVFVAGGVLLLAVALLARLDEEPNYLYLLHILCYLVGRKKFERLYTDRQILLRGTDEGNEEAFQGVFEEEEEESPRESKEDQKARKKAEDKILKSKTATQEEKDAILERRRIENAAAAEKAAAAKEAAAKRKAEDKILKNKKASQEEKEAILERRKIESAEAARRMAEAKEASTKREPMQRLSAFTDIRDGYLEYGGQYFGTAIEIPPVEFRFFSASRRSNSIENGFGRVLRALPQEYSANLVKIERPILYDEYLDREYDKLDELRATYEQGMIREDELQSRVEILYDRINDLRNLCYGDKVIEAFYYLVFFDSDKRQLDILVNTALDALHGGELNPKRLNTKELAVFMKYTNQLDFDEREIEQIAPEDYAEWAMPQTVDMKARTVEVNHIVTHNMRFVKYPTVVGDAWLAGVASMPGTKVVVKFRPMDRTKAMRGIDRSLQELRGQWGSTQIDSKRVELEEHIGTLSTLLSTLQSDNESLLETSIYVTSYDIATTRARAAAVQPPKSSLPNITNMKKSVRRLYQESGFRLNNMEFGQFSAYVGSQVSGYDPMLSDSRGIPSNTLAASFPWIFAKVSDPNGIKIGVSDGVPVFVDFFRRDSERVNSNMVIVGKSGSGKSYATKSLLANLAADGAKIFILDPENEYTELANNLHGKFINVGNAQHGRMNPFHIISALDDDEGSESDSGSYATHLQFLEEFFHQLLPDCDKDSMEYLNSLVNRMYFGKGISDGTDLSKLRPEDYPIFDDLYDIILKEFQSTDNEYIRTMLRTLTNYIAKFSLGGRNANIWNGPSTITTDENFTVFNFQSLLANRNGTIANAQMLLVLKYIDNEIIKNRDYNTKYHMKRKIVIVIDEAHVFIDTKFPVALDFMFQLAKRIRKYNGMQIVITQNIKDFVGSEEIARKSTAIINACQYSFIFALSPNDMDDLCKLYEKAGGINENEQEQIIRAGRGQAFTVFSPQSRSSFKILVPPDIREMFKEMHYRSHYFDGEQGKANWEDFIGDSREKRTIIETVAAVEDQMEAETAENGSSSVFFKELDTDNGETLETLFNSDASEEKAEPAILLRELDETEQLEELTFPGMRPEDTKPASEFSELSVAAPTAAAVAPQVIVHNDNSRMEALLGELLNKLTYESVMGEVRQSIREEVLREMAAAGAIAAVGSMAAGAVAEPVAEEAAFERAEAGASSEEPLMDELPQQTEPEDLFVNDLLQQMEPVSEELPAAAEEPMQEEEPVTEEAEQSNVIVEVDEEVDEEEDEISRILNAFLDAQNEERPSLIEQMRKYHDTMINISLEELAYHNLRRGAAK